MLDERQPTLRRVATIFGSLFGAIALVNFASGGGEGVETVCSKDPQSLRAQLTGGSYIVEDQAVFDSLQLNTTYKITYDKTRWLLHLEAVDPVPPDAQKPDACKPRVSRRTS